MKIRNVALTLICFFVVLPIYTEVKKVVIRNDYSKTVIINIDGKDVMRLGQGQAQVLQGWPRQIKIKTEGSPFYHSGIQEEYLYITNLNRINNPTHQEATINIVPTTNILHFNYNTTVKDIPKGPAPTRSLPQIPGVKKSIVIRNNTNNQITLRIATEDEAFPPKTLNINDSVNFEVYDEMIFKTAMAEVGKMTINLLPQMRNCLQTLNTFTTGTHTRIVHINSNGSTNIESKD